MASAANLPRLNESAGRCRYTHSSSFSSFQNILPSMSGIRVNSSNTSRTVGLVMVSDRFLWVSLVLDYWWYSIFEPSRVGQLP